jgi:hypothetical protein
VGYTVMAQADMAVIGFVLVVSGILVGFALASDERTEQPQASATGVSATSVAAVGDAPLQGGTSRATIGDSDRSSSVGSDLSVPASIESAYQESMVDLDEVYHPLRESLQYHVDFYLDQIADLTLEEVRELFRDDWPNGKWTDYYMPCLGRGTLKGRFGFPTFEDADRLWNAPGFQTRFITYLDLEHRSFVQHELAVGAFDDPGMLSLSKETGAKAGEAWEVLWETPDLYPNWPFLMEVGRRHLR